LGTKGISHTAYQHNSIDVIILTFYSWD